VPVPAGLDVCNAAVWWQVTEPVQQLFARHGPPCNAGAAVVTLLLHSWAVAGPAAAAAAAWQPAVQQQIPCLHRTVLRTAAQIERSKEHAKGWLMAAEWLC
jgi:hypothetical protein